MAATTRFGPLARYRLFSYERRAVVEGGGVARVSLYMVFRFVHVVRAIKAGTLNLEYSFK